jgi:hypothetical protein
LDTWGQIIKPSLNQPVEVVEHFFIDAVSRPDGEDFVDRLNVVSMTLNKDPKDTEHEIIIIKTKDTKDGVLRFFTLHRLPAKPSNPPTTTRMESTDRPDTDTDRNKLLAGLSNFMPSLSRPVSPGSSSLMEEGRLASTLTSSSAPNLCSPLSFPNRQLLLGDAVSLKAVQAVSDSKGKGSNDLPIDANDRMIGGDSMLDPQYACGRNARVLEPSNLSLFDLTILAQAVHEFAPHYAIIGKNCYWFCNIIFDACIELFPPDNLDSPVENIRKFGLHEDEISGRFRGFKVSATNDEDLSVILRKYKKAHTKAFGKVNCLHLKYYSLLILNRF